MMRLVIPLALLAALITLVAARNASSGSTPPSINNGETRYAISPAWPSGIQAFLRVETSQPVFERLYQYGRTTAASSGAYGPNVGASSSHWFVEYQRAGATDVIAGVLRGDSSLIDDGLRMFRFALNRETAGGAFPGSAWPFHGTAMFLAEAAPALLVLKYSSVDAKYAPELSWQIQRMRQAARHLIQVVHGVGKIDDISKNHRRFEAAMALEASGVLVGDQQLVAWSRSYAWQGIHMTQAGGVMPENGGHDTGYQGLGMAHATRYLELLAQGSLRRALYSTLSRAETWEFSRVRGDGTIDQVGDTRSAGCRERDPLGQCKTAMYAPIFSALIRWAVITSDARYANAAYLVWKQNLKLVLNGNSGKP